MELEISTLNLLTDCGNLEKAWELGLKSDHFGSDLNKKVFEFMLDYWFKSDSKIAATYDVVKYEFPSFKYTDEEETLVWLIEKLKEKYKRNRSAEALEDIAILIDDDKVDAAIKLMATQAHVITLSVTTRKSVSDMSTNIDERRRRYSERASFDGTVKGCPIGLPEVDSHTFGFLPGELWMGAGYAGTGKSWLLANAAISAAKAGWIPYIETLELPRKDIEDRIDALHSGLPYGPLSRGKLDREQVDRLKASQDELKNMLIVDEPPEDERTVQSLINRALQRGANYVLIDQLSFINGTKDYYRSVTDKTTEIMNDLKQSIDTIPALVAVQFNRESKKDGKGGLHHLADAAAIERVADGVFGLDQTKELSLNNMMELSLMKFRRGPKASWMLNWNLRSRTEISVDDIVDE